MKFKNLGLGLGLRSPHLDDILNGNSDAKWFEALSENYMGLEGHGAGPALTNLLEVRKNFPVVLHGVSMNIGSTDPLNYRYLEKLKNLRDQVQPEWISDHLCWTGVNGKNSHDLLPLPYSSETLKLLTERILKVQDFFGHEILLENLSSYIQYNESGLVEAEFINELVKATDVKLLMDINNIEVNAYNHDFNAETYIQMIPSDSVIQIHLAGHTDKGNYKVDTHSTPMSEETLRLFKYANKLWGSRSTMVEWDADIPSMHVLNQELRRVRKILNEENTK